MLVRFRFSEQHLGQVTGYAVALPGPDGGTAWTGAGRLALELSLPRLRRCWQTGAGAGLGGASGLTDPERSALYDHAARQAAVAAEHIRRHAADDPELAADAAYAAADALHVAARVTRSRTLRRAADAYDHQAASIASSGHDGRTTMTSVAVDNTLLCPQDHPPALSAPVRGRTMRGDAKPAEHVAHQPGRELDQRERNELMSALTSSAAFWMFLILLLAALYLLPTLIALIRGTDHLALIFLINLIGTPALIGWPAALILAFGPRRLPPQPTWQPPPHAAPPAVPRAPKRWDARS